MLSLLSAVPSIQTCPGDTRSPYTCNQDETHRVCAQLMDTTTSPPSKVMWGTQDFWALTNQEAFDWSEDIVAEPNPGDSWCICMWATEELIEQVGCSNIHIRCESTDVNYILDAYSDTGMTGEKNLAEAHECLCSQCPDQAEDGSCDAARRSSKTGASRQQTLLALQPSGDAATPHHHPTAEQACEACTNATYSSCHAGLCSDDSGDFCWCSPDDGLACPPTGYESCHSLRRRLREVRMMQRRRERAEHDAQQPI